jgi:hypothetical protein
MHACRSGVKNPLLNFGLWTNNPIIFLNKNYNIEKLDTISPKKKKN